MAEINLKSRNIGDYEIKFLSESLVSNEVPLIIDLIHLNHHSFISFQALTLLDLSDNKIGDIGAQQLADALRDNEVGFLELCLILFMFYIIYRHYAF